MITMTTNEERQLEQCILSGKEYAKLFLVRMCHEHCRHTDWFTKIVPDLVKVKYDNRDYLFERYKSQAPTIRNTPNITLVPVDAEVTNERIVLVNTDEFSDIYRQLMKNLNKYCKELWSLYEKTWKLTAERLAREAKHK